MVNEELSDVPSGFARTMVTDSDSAHSRSSDRADRGHHALWSPGIAEGDGRKLEVEQQPGSGCAMSLNLVI
jgi:hypothetical protein